MIINISKAAKISFIFYFSDFKMLFIGADFFLYDHNWVLSLMVFKLCYHKAFKCFRLENRNRRNKTASNKETNNRVTKCCFGVTLTR